MQSVPQQRKNIQRKRNDNFQVTSKTYGNNRGYHTDTQVALNSTLSTSMFTVISEAI